MDKFRALTIYAKSLLRNFQGSGELFDFNHIFYEAKRVIEKNGWEQEAIEELDEVYKNVEQNYSSLEKDYAEYLKSGEKTEEQEQYFNRCFHKLGIDDRTRIKIEYKIRNGEKPTLEEFKKLVEEKEEEDERNALTFIRNQVNISNGKDFDRGELLKSAKYLKDRGLYNIVLRNLASAISCYDAEELIKDYDSGFQLFLY